MAGYAAALAALSDEHLTRLLRRRPDLLAGTAPASFPELASRAGTAASLSAALGSLDVGSLQLAELLAVIGLPTTLDVLRRAAGPNLRPAALQRGLAKLAELGLAVSLGDGTIVGPRGLGAPFGAPGGLGPSVADLARIGVSLQQLGTVADNLGLDRPPRKADLVRVVAGGLSDPELVAGVLAEADGGALELLNRALAGPGPLTVQGVGYGRFAGYPDARPATWLLERGLLLPMTYSQYVVPREAALALRGGLVFPDWPEEPEPPTAEPVAGLAERAVGAAQRAVVAAEGLVARLDSGPLALIQSGTVAVRDLRRLAKELDVAEDEVALLVDLLVAAEVLTVGGPWDQRTLALRPEADAWLAQSRARRWADLVVVWRDSDLAFEDHLLDRHGLVVAGADKPRPLSLRRQSAAIGRRHSLLDLLAVLPADRGVDARALGRSLGWHSPSLWGGPRGELARVILDAAAFLGLAVTADGLAGAAPAVRGGWTEGGDAAELAAAVAEALPDGARRFLVAGDLTVVAPGGLAPDVETSLAGLAARQTGAGAALWRIDEPSLRRAFDEGRTADEVLEFLREHSDTPLPQALEYLVGDAARRHGRLRVGGASTYLRGDPALVAGLVRSATGRRLGLRELGPGVAVTQRSQRELLAGLRKAGEAPLAEDPDGTPRLEARKSVRHPARAAAADFAVSRRARTAPTDEAARVVARLRVSAPTAAPDPGALATSPAEVAALCQGAADQGAAVEIAYLGRSGQTTVRTIEPVSVRAGRVQAWCRLRTDDRTFDLARVQWARTADQEPAGRG